MSFNKSPQNLIPGWVAQGSSYVVPASFLQDLTKDQADPSAGDSRAIIYAFLEGFYRWYNSLDQDNRPTKLEVGRSSYVDDRTNTISRSYSFTVETSLAALSVTDEQPQASSDED
jgi:hypothetical protein